MNKSISYDGIGANKTHKYNRKEFLKMMNKTAKEDCSRWLIGLKYKPCVKDRAFFRKMAKTQKFKDPSSYTKKQRKNFLTCAKKMFDKKTLKRPKYKCDIDKYITYSGAVEK